MNKPFLILLGICTTLSGYSQFINDSGNHSLTLITTKESDRMNRIEGSPYLQEDFEYGTAMVEGKQPLKIFMRYNVHQEQIEIKTDVQDDKTYLLPKKESTVYEIGPKTFILDEIVFDGKRISGYFIEHYKGENYRLLKKPFTTVTEAIKAKTGYDQDKPARIKIEEEFYVVNKSGGVRNVRVKHRDIKKSFNSNSAKEYLSDHKIRSEEDLIDFVSFLDKQ